MKVLIVVEAIPPYCGGGEQVAWMQANALAKTDEVALITFGDSNKTEQVGKLKIYYLEKKKRQLAYYLTFGQKIIATYLSEIKPDIIHYHMPNVLGLCIKKKYGYVVSTIHDGIPENRIKQLSGCSWKDYIKFKVFRKLNIGKSDLVTCVSQHSCLLTQGLYSNKKDKIVFIPNPIDYKYLEPVNSARSGETALNFGRQIELKMGSLIEVARLLPELDFQFIGSGPMVTDYGLSNIRFSGFMQDFVSEIDKSKFCIFPSQSENFPLSGLEAMARGKPVIASKIGFSEYIVHKENGILLEDNRPETIVKAVKELLADKELYKKLSVNARLTAEKYTPDSIANQYKTVINQFIEKATD